MNEKGYSWPETILTVAVLSIVFGTLLPLATNMTTLLYKKKTAMYAAETAYQGTVAYLAYGQKEGRREVEKKEYLWHIDQQSICVHYEMKNEVMKKCVNFAAE